HVTAQARRVRRGGRAGVQLRRSGDDVHRRSQPAVALANAAGAALHVELTEAGSGGWEGYGGCGGLDFPNLPNLPNLHRLAYPDLLHHPMHRVRLAVRGVGHKTGEHVRADRKSTRLNSSHLVISYAVFCLKKKIKRI